MNTRREPTLGGRKSSVYLRMAVGLKFAIIGVTKQRRHGNVYMERVTETRVITESNMGAYRKMGNCTD